MMETTPEKSELPLVQRLNLRSLAQEQGVVEGRLALTHLPRLESVLVANSEQRRQLHVDWRMRGFTRSQAGDTPQLMIELHVLADLPMQCQRCLQPAFQRILDVALFRIVDEEPELTVEELEAEEEPLCVQGLIDAVVLVEDQVLLALPLVPMHDVCPQPIIAQGLLDEAAAKKERESPFAVLAKLKTPS